MSEIIDNHIHVNKITFDKIVSRISSLESERDRLKAELEVTKRFEDICREALKDRDLWKSRCEEWEEKYKKLDCEFDIDHAEMKSRADKMAEALRKLADENHMINDCGDLEHSTHCVKCFAKEALAESEKGGK